MTKENCKDCECAGRHWPCGCECHSDAKASAMGLLCRAADKFADGDAPDADWFREYFVLTGEHMILSEEGWEDGEAKAEYLKDDPDWQPLDEVNAPRSVLAEIKDLGIGPRLRS